jgi:hypothetical protein
VAKFSIRRFDNQAQMGAVLSLISIAPLAALIFFIARNMDRQEWIFYYGTPSRIAVLLSAMVSLLLSGMGFGFGLNSAGQRRNDKQQLSWVGFFTGAIVLALTFVMLSLFFLRGEAIVGK